MGVGEVVRERRRRGERKGLGRAEGARRKKWGQNRRAAAIFLQGNRNIKAYFQIFFACGALNLLCYQIYEPTPYTTILREPKNTNLRAILYYKMRIFNANCVKFSPAANLTKNYTQMVPHNENFCSEIMHPPPPKA